MGSAVSARMRPSSITTQPATANQNGSNVARMGSNDSVPSPMVVVQARFHPYPGQADPNVQWQTPRGNQEAADIKGSTPLACPGVGPSVAEPIPYTPEGGYPPDALVHTWGRIPVGEADANQPPPSNQPPTSDLIELRESASTFLSSLSGDEIDQTVLPTNENHSPLAMTFETMRSEIDDPGINTLNLTSTTRSTGIEDIGSSTLNLTSTAEVASIDNVVSPSVDTEEREIAVVTLISDSIATEEILSEELSRAATTNHVAPDISSSDNTNNNISDVLSGDNTNNNIGSDNSVSDVITNNNIGSDISSSHINTNNNIGSDNSSSDVNTNNNVGSDLSSSDINTNNNIGSDNSSSHVNTNNNIGSDISNTDNIARPVLPPLNWSMGAAARLPSIGQVNPTTENTNSENQSSITNTTIEPPPVVAPLVATARGSTPREESSDNYHQLEQLCQSCVESQPSTPFLTPQETPQETPRETPRVRRRSLDPLNVQVSNLPILNAAPLMNTAPLPTLTNDNDNNNNNNSSSRSSNDTGNNSSSNENIVNNDNNPNQNQTNNVPINRNPSPPSVTSSTVRRNSYQDHPNRVLSDVGNNTDSQSVPTDETQGNEPTDKNPNEDIADPMDQTETTT